MYISNCFLQEYLGCLDGDSIKVFLYRKAFGKCDDLSNIADFLHLTTSKIQECIKQLVDLGMWSISIKEIQEKLQSDLPILLRKNNNSLNLNIKNWICLKTSNEIDSMINTTLSEIEPLIFFLSEKWGQPLSSVTIFFLLYCIDFLGLPIDVVQYLFTKSKANTDLNTLLIRAEMWADFELTDLATIYYYENNRVYYLNAVKEAFSVDDTFTRSELIYIFDWMLRDKYPLELVVYACLITKEQINKISLPYANKILANWREGSIMSVEDIIHGKILRNIPKKHQMLLQKQTQCILIKIGKFDQNCNIT